MSGLTGQGVSELIAEIEVRLASLTAGSGVITRERHCQFINRAIGAMESARIELKKAKIRSEIVADELRTALRALEGLVGRVDVENLLDEIFSSFCIGK